MSVEEDRAFFAAQRRVRDAKRELKSAEDALWALLGEKSPASPASCRGEGR
jgi:hypothetical protein